MTWEEAKSKAAEIINNLRAQFGREDIRLILRALNRRHHKDKMNTPTIIIAEVGPDSFQIDVSGRYGGGFSNFRTNRAGVMERLGLLKRYDCGEEPAVVIVPDSLRPEFQKVFPKSFNEGVTPPQFERRQE